MIIICDTETVSKDKFLDDLVKYMSEHGRVETVDLYNHLPQVQKYVKGVGGRHIIHVVYYKQD